MTFTLGYSILYYPLEEDSKFGDPTIYLLKVITSKHAIFEYYHIYAHKSINTNFLANPDHLIWITDYKRVFIYFSEPWDLSSWNKNLSF